MILCFQSTKRHVSFFNLIRYRMEAVSIIVVTRKCLTWSGHVVPCCTSWSNDIILHCWKLVCLKYIFFVQDCACFSTSWHYIVALGRASNNNTSFCILLNVDPRGSTRSVCNVPATGRRFKFCELGVVRLAVDRFMACAIRYIVIYCLWQSFYTLRAGVAGRIVVVPHTHKSFFAGP